ncbi:MAG: hypothetical protein AVDCRST_MAG17-1921, partial [uncultured Solirubrobacterales bacterium]
CRPTQSSRSGAKLGSIARAAPRAAMTSWASRSRPARFPPRPRQTGRGSARGRGSLSA